ncbi:hypothetical protein [Nocardiopsis sp. CC223A]|uniref:hypothetical protein n=1 Tax=Nocardiopsis sp. CC223A TaxID=3044051 RepID=UPI00278C8C0E|nr:hypothetical protein [Nocardiopsis sp. CC223A]
MNLLLAEVGKKGAEHWWTLLALPGVLFLLALAASALLEPGDLLDPGTALPRAEEDLRSITGTEPPVTTAQIAALLITVTLLGHAAALAAKALTPLVRTVWLPARNRPGTGPGGRPSLKQVFTSSKNPLDWLTLLRIRRWEGLGFAEQSRMALIRPERPTWMGDRMAALAQRVQGNYGLHVGWTWPRLLLLLPDRAVDLVDRTRGDLDRACALGAWGVLYLLASAAACALSRPWWPMALIGAVCLVTAWWQARGAVDRLATLVESCYDLHHRELLTATPDKAGPEGSPFDTRQGTDLTLRFSKNR